MLQQKGTATLYTERLILRKFTPEDAEGMYRNWANDPRVARYLSWKPHTSVEVTDQIVAHWCSKYESDAYYNWVIEYEGEPIGNVELMGCDGSYGMIGYALGYAYWNKGIMTEAVKRILGYLLDEQGLKHITIKHAPSNPASGRVAAKCGLRYVGMEAFGRTLSGGETVKSLCVSEIIR